LKNYSILPSVKLPKRLGCVEERHELLQWGPGRGPGRKNDFSVFQASNNASR